MNKKILQAYATVLVRFALNSGKGIRRGEVVAIQGDVVALPLLREIYHEVLSAGAHPIVRMSDEEMAKIYFETASDEQLSFFPRRYMKSYIDAIDHRIAILADTNPLLLSHVDPKKIMKSNEPYRAVRKWLFDKEDKGKLTWTLALYGTEGMAKEAGLTYEAYWDQIIEACFLNARNPLEKWRNVFSSLEILRKKLNALAIEKVHVEAQGTDLWVSIGAQRQWLGGSGRNIPSFELFTSPDWRGTEGHISFNFPLYRYGSRIEDIYLEFKKGVVVQAKARKNEHLLAALIAQKNANKVGEFSLTDTRYSRITHFMANTLYDENIGGTYGNTHIALGTSYHEAYTKGTKGVSVAQWTRLGFNESVEHTDIMATTDRVVTAFSKSGKRVVYRRGKFVL